MTLLSKDLACCSCAVISPREIDIDNLAPVLQLVLKTSSFRWDASVCDHDIEVAKISDDRIYTCLNLRLSARNSHAQRALQSHLLKILHCALISLAPNSKVLFDTRSQLQCMGRFVIPERNV